MTTGIDKAIALAGGQARLGGMLGISQQMVGRMKARGYAPVHHAIAIATHYGIPVEELVGPNTRKAMGLLS